MTGDQFVQILQAYHCQDKVVSFVTGIVRRQKTSKGDIKVLLRIIDCRDRFVLRRFPDLFFEAEFEYVFIPGRKVIEPGQQLPEPDTLKLGARSAEELTREQFEQRTDEKASEALLDEARKIINPKENEKD